MALVLCATSYLDFFIKGLIQNKLTNMGNLILDELNGILIKIWGINRNMTCVHRFSIALGVYNPQKMGKMIISNLMMGVRTRYIKEEIKFVCC